MRILVSALGSFGHTFPLIPLSLAIRDRGDQVTFATDAAMTTTVRDLGLPTADAGISIYDAFARLGMPSAAPSSFASDPDALAQARRAFAEVLPEVFAADLAGVIDRSRPDLLIAEAANLGAIDAAATADIPCVVHGFGRGIPFDMDLGSLPYLDIYPASMQDSAGLAITGRQPLRPVAFAPDGELPEIVGRDDPRPLVYVTLGTAFASVEVLDTIIDAVDDGSRRVLVAVGPAADVAGLRPHSDSVQVSAWVPQSQVLPHVAVIVHHGGAGTTLSSAGAGVPQVITPQGADQFINAEAVSERGVGLQVLPAEMSGEVVAEAVTRLLGDDTARVACAEVADEIASMSAPSQVAATLDMYAQTPARP